MMMVFAVADLAVISLFGVFRASDGNPFDPSRVGLNVCSSIMSLPSGKMRPNGMIMRYTSTGSTGSSEHCSFVDEDPFIVSMQLLVDPGVDNNVGKAYQGMVNMLDDDLQVICVSDKRELSALPACSPKESSELTVPCLATVLFFNGCQKKWSETRNGKTVGSKLGGTLSKPDLLLNHMWNDSRDLEEDFKNALDLNGNDVRNVVRRTISQQKCYRNSPKSGRSSPFLRYDDILEECKEKPKSLTEMRERDAGFRKEIFNFEVSERTLEARKQLETWPWEFHHKADTTRGISQCHGNAQDFYAYQPDRDVTRLYGDVIDTTKISRKKNMTPINFGKDKIVNLLQNETVKLREKGHRAMERPVYTTDFPLMAVREVHYGRQHLRYTLFVSDDAWTNQVEFYRLLLRRYEITLREDFCFFTVYYGEDTDIQFALKKLSPKQRPIPLSSTVLQFKVHKVGQLVPLLPRACKPISDRRWQTKDHDGNILILYICQGKTSSDTSSSCFAKDSTSLDDAVTSRSETRQSDGDEDEFSLERLDSFIEPELPARMPLLNSSLYTNLTGRSRFSSRNTSSASPGSSSSTSPERRPRRMGEYSHRRMFSGSSLELSSVGTLPNPHHTSNSSWTSKISESSDEPENTNFYRRAKFKRDIRRRNDGAVPPKPKPRSKSSSRSTKQKHKTVTRTKSREEEIEVYV